MWPYTLQKEMHWPILIITWLNFNLNLDNQMCSTKYDFSLVKALEDSLVRQQELVDYLEEEKKKKKKKKLVCY